MEGTDIFAENPLLMIKKIRLYAETGNTVPEDVKCRIIVYGHFLKKLDRKIIRDELDAALMSEKAEEIFRMFFKCGILKNIFPQLDRCFYEPQKNKYHVYNVGEHIIHTVSSTPYIPAVRWAALMHDIGKPMCSSCDSAGVIHFYGHHTESVKIARDVCYKFSFDESLRKEICTLIEYHDVHFEATEKGVKRALAKLGETTFLHLLSLQEADASAKSPLYTVDKCAVINSLRNLCASIIRSGQPYSYSELAIGKRDLIKMKYHSEHQMRDVLRLLFDEIIDNPSLNNREYLIKRARKLKNGHH